MKACLLLLMSRAATLSKVVVQVAQSSLSLRHVLVQAMSSQDGAADTTEVETRVLNRLLAV